MDCILESPGSSIIDSGTVHSTLKTECSDFTVPEMGPENSASKVTCRVCQEMIDVIGKKDQHVVKCSRCNEATVSLLLDIFISILVKLNFYLIIKYCHNFILIGKSLILI